ncbi:hypothetical protein ABRY23_10505 [Melioribacteraceae bacterium 4301-Me]|uniref:hypothetical protein n=1 Tax=Pyranulibacter aquaticus TaxID=3163344 RepID=UPI00359A485B
MTKRKFDFTSSKAILIYFSSFELLLLLLFAGNYGLFRDEYYYIECSKHLSFGYVDQPPLSIFILFISRTLFDLKFSIKRLHKIQSRIYWCYS